MKIIIVQGMSCLGKTALSEKLSNMLPRSKVYCLDKYIEDLCDKLGYSNLTRKEALCDKAQDAMYSEIEDSVNASRYDYFIIEHSFVERYVDRLDAFLDKVRDKVFVNTLYLCPVDTEAHRAVWEKDHLDFTKRHPSKGATKYLNCEGSNYHEVYEDVCFTDMDVFGDTLKIDVNFKPYKLGVAYEDICGFVRS